MNFSDRKLEYWGVEPSSAAEQAQVVLDHVLAGTYDAVEGSLPSNYFDVVICNDVIEHLPDHDAFLASIKGKLASGGSLVASLPNVRYIENLKGLLLARDWQYTDAGILDRTHLRFFTRKSICRTLQEHGFQIDEMVGLNQYRRGGVSGLATWLWCLVFGRDIVYLQFGVRCSKNPQAD